MKDATEFIYIYLKFQDIRLIKLANKQAILQFTFKF